MTSGAHLALAHLIHSLGKGGANNIKTHAPRRWPRQVLLSLGSRALSKKSSCYGPGLQNAPKSMAGAVRPVPSLKRPRRKGSHRTTRTQTRLGERGPGHPASLPTRTERTLFQWGFPRPITLPHRSPGHSIFGRGSWGQCVAVTWETLRKLYSPRSRAPPRHQVLHKEENLPSHDSATPHYTTSIFNPPQHQCPKEQFEKQRSPSKTGKIDDRYWGSASP